MKTELLIETLIEQTQQVIAKAEDLKATSIEILMWRENSQSWNILECLQHLNLYGDYYLPEIAKAISNSNTKKEAVFKAGVLGNYFAKSMLPKENLNKMNTFKDKNPINHSLELEVVDNFVHQQYEFIKLLNQSRNVSLNKVKIATSISKLIKLKLGDTFQFLVNHNLRHFAQIDRIKTQISGVNVDSALN